MFRRTFVAAAAMAVVFTGTSALADAITDPSRPAADTARDASRKPAEVLAFSGMKAGDTVIELLPGGGYFTRIFSKQVGPNGKVIAAVPAPTSPDAQPAVAKIAAEPGYGNISVQVITQLAPPAPADIIFTAQNYHDLHLKRISANIDQAGKGWLAALKPGGVLIVVDHVAATGAPVQETADALHRIDPAVVRKEMEAAGFVFDGESSVLRNPADTHTVGVFDASIRGTTDQFMYRFKKPAA